MKSGNVNSTQISNTVASLLHQCVTDIPPSHKVWKKRKRKGWVLISLGPIVQGR